MQSSRPLCFEVATGSKSLFCATPSEEVRYFPAVRPFVFIAVASSASVRRYSECWNLYMPCWVFSSVKIQCVISRNTNDLCHLHALISSHIWGHALNLIVSVCPSDHDASLPCNRFNVHMHILDISSTWRCRCVTSGSWPSIRRSSKQPIAKAKVIKSTQAVIACMCEIWSNLCPWLVFLASAWFSSCFGGQAPHFLLGEK